ncbi:hypothetical protein B9Z65_6550 [Elsinoe australis]|uniref:Major facilitator superfamily (MFS) profile domain-containing protein n=1 Tax=Elsinoe australis TaxID=40998 RepID=A0A2P8A8Y6_9PEZI|nr:hypothetical protein B9Z65_6550 [Elsinoe australis]
MERTSTSTSEADKDVTTHKEFRPMADIPEDTMVELQQQYVRSGFMGMIESKYVVLCAFVVRLGGFLFGYDQGVISIINVMDQFLDRFPRVADDYSGAGFWKGLMTAMIQLGALIGAINQGWIAERISRRYSIIVAVIIFVIGSAIQTGAVDYAMLVVGRLIGGVGVGMLSMVVPLYISEVSPPEIRGSLLVLEEFSIVFGIIVAYWITFGTRYIPNEWSYRLPFLLQIFPALLLGVAVLWIPFSPRWLACKGRDDECLTSLCKLRNLPPDDPRVQAEWLDIRAEVAFHREVAKKKHPGLAEKSEKNLWAMTKFEISSYLDCFRQGYWRRTMVGIMIMFFQQFVGINALIYYSPTLFQTMGIEYNMRLVLGGVLNVTQLVGVATSLYTMDKFGRRPLLYLGSAGMSICHIIIAVLVGLYFDTWADNRDKGWVSVAFLFIYMLIFGMTWGPVPWAMPSEIFPSSIRAKGVAWSTCSN